MSEITSRQKAVVEILAGALAGVYLRGGKPIDIDGAAINPVEGWAAMEIEGHRLIVRVEDAPDA